MRLSQRLPDSTTETAFILFQTAICFKKHLPCRDSARKIKAPFYSYRPYRDVAARCDTYRLFTVAGVPRASRPVPNRVGEVAVIATTAAMKRSELHRLVDDAIERAMWDENPLVAWQNFINILETDGRRAIGDKLEASGCNRYTGEVRENVGA